MFEWLEGWVEPFLIVMGLAAGVGLVAALVWVGMGWSERFGRRRRRREAKNYGPSIKKP